MAITVNAIDFSFKKTNIKNDFSKDTCYNYSKKAYYTNKKIVLKKVSYIDY